jgi:putative FmdB family regulatory protein
VIKIPIYEYLCKECGHTLEKIQKFSDEPLKDCPECTKAALEKQISTGTGFCLMGNHWHRPGLKGPRHKNCQ